MTGVHDARGLGRVNLAEALRRLLDRPLRQRLDSQLPSHYTVPTGSRLPLCYQQGEPPVRAVRMQEMFGERQTPRVAEGRVAVVLELLSPAHRPLQITRDLAAFWRGSLSRGAKRDERALSKTPLAGRSGVGAAHPAHP